jgi:HD-GYP domain-containing protein (c-di-GMP phosphodiesterase class II)
MFEQVILTRDLVDTRGAVLAHRGSVLSPAMIEEAADRAIPPPRLSIGDTTMAEDLRSAIADRAYWHLFRGAGVDAAVWRALGGIRLPQALLEELQAMKGSDPARYRHAVSTAAITARMLIAAVGDAPAMAELLVAALLHDLGMRHVSFHLLRNADELEPTEVEDVAMHPLLGAWHLAGYLGRHPAVEAALAHHWRSGRGYPTLPRAPARAVEVVAVASAFAALTQARPFRPAPYDARGAVDVMVAEANTGQRDVDTVRLLVHALRGARGEVREVRFARARLGHAPSVNRHTPIAAPRNA